MRPLNILVPSCLLAVMLLTGSLVHGPLAAVSVVRAQDCAEVQATAYDDPSEVSDRGVISQNSALGQSFTIPATVGSLRLTRVSLYLDLMTASPLSVSVRASDGGLPGAVLASVTQTPSASSPSFVDFPFTDEPLTLEPDTLYYLTATVSDPTASFSWGLDTRSPTYRGGNLVLSQNQGSAWIPEPSFAALFQVWGYAEVDLDADSENECAGELSALRQKSNSQARLSRLTAMDIRA
jgi:hypothetical protein